MNRLLTACLALMAAAAPAFAAGCNDKVEKQLKLSSPDQPDTFVVESFGDQCQGARLVIYVKTATNQWAPLIISEVSDYGSEPKNAQELRTALKEVADRIEGKAKPRYVYIPTDAVRAKLVVWDEHVYGGRPVDFVYYGD
jgi:hypothetical protein